MEPILLSQGSPIVNPPHRLLLQTDEPAEGSGCATPASSTVRRASSSVDFNAYWEPSYGFIVDRLDFTAKNFDLYLQNTGHFGLKNEFDHFQISCLSIEWWSRLIFRVWFHKMWLTQVRGGRTVLMRKSDLFLLVQCFANLSGGFMSPWGDYQRKVPTKQTDF